MKLDDPSRLPLLWQGKVRQVHDAGPGRLLLVTSSRVSAFDVVFPQPVPGKAEVLNLLAAWWFRRTAHIVPNHLVETRASAILADDASARAHRGRVALVERSEPVRFECVVRGHLDGSAWKEYERTGRVVDHEPPPGLRRYDALPEPIFTPATKAETGHDENVPRAALVESLGGELAGRLERLSLELYAFGRAEAAKRGLMLLDTKFEFGIAADGRLLLIDEAFTPDSSRYRAGDGAGGGEAFDKQFLRDWLLERGFSGDGPPPDLPPEVVAELSRRYRAVFERLAGEDFDAHLQQFG